MRGTAVERVSCILSAAAPAPSPAPADPAPSAIVLEQRPEGAGRFILLLLLAPALAALMAPFWLVIRHLAFEPAARALLAAQPWAGVQLMLGLVVLMGLFGWPLCQLAGALPRRRRITIAGGWVLAEGLGRLAGGTRPWAEPISAYAGLTHRVRTSLSGVRHELVLVHRRPSRSVILESASHISQEALQAAARRLALAEIPSREAASVTPLHGFFQLAEPQPQLAAA